MICELAINAVLPLGMKHDGKPTGTIVFCCYGHMWLSYRQVSEKLTHDIQTHLVHQGTFCLVLRSWKICNSGNCLMILKNVLLLPLQTEVMSSCFICLFVCQITQNLYQAMNGSTKNFYQKCALGQGIIDYIL